MRDNRQSYRLELAHVVVPTPANELQVALAKLSLDAWTLVWLLVEGQRPPVDVLEAWEGVVADLDAVLARAIDAPAAVRREVH